MSRRHVIVEGPDGSGKTTIVEAIEQYLHLPRRPRASTSLDGPVPNLTKWVVDERNWMDMNLRNPHVYDRHPLISEPIYGTIVRKKPQPGFHPYHDRSWLATARLALRDRALVVWCLPGVATVRGNVQANAATQMPGVVDNISELYAAYSDAYGAWGGPSIIWSYVHHQRADLLAQIKEEVNR